MYENINTFNTDPRSIYILVLNQKTNPFVANFFTIMFPVSIFLVGIPAHNLYNTKFDLEPSYFYYCFLCASPYQQVQNSKDIGLLSDSTYAEKWKFSKSNIQLLMKGPTGLITSCEKLIWIKWLATYSSGIRKLFDRCTKPMALVDLLARSVHSNLTVTVNNEIDLSYQGFTGSTNLCNWNST
jgi:hypothetical protein